MNVTPTLDKEIYTLQQLFSLEDRCNRCCYQSYHTYRRYAIRQTTAAIISTMSMRWRWTSWSAWWPSRTSRWSSSWASRRSSSRASWRSSSRSSWWSSSRSSWSSHIHSLLPVYQSIFLFSSLNIIAKIQGNVMLSFYCCTDQCDNSDHYQDWQSNRNQSLDDQSDQNHRQKY